MHRPLILDGAMGTMIQSAGLKLGEKPEIFVLKNPDAVMEIQKEYIKAGSDVLYSNTFGANRHKMQDTGYDIPTLIKANIGIAKKAAQGKKVALDIGPIGELMAPLGTLSFDEAYDIFKEMIVAGRDAGADLVVFETFTDLYEVKAGVLAAKENSDLPVWVTMSFEQDGRTFTGTTVECMATTLDALGVDAMGINCSLGPKEIYPLIERMAKCTTKPLIAKPNAGLPDPATGTYFITPKDFASQMKDYLDLGIMAMGGCCGTTPAFIKELSKVAEQGSRQRIIPEEKGCVCSSSKLVIFDKINIIGEKINPTGRKSLKEALLSHDMDFVMNLAIAQADGGADILDINVGVPGIDESAMMKEVVQAVQSVVSLPLMIDSSDAKAIETGLRYANGKVIVNSVNANDSKLKEILPIAAKYGAAVVGLAMDRGIPSSVQERMDHAAKIRDKALEAGIRKCDIIIDCLTLTISAQQDQAVKTLEAVHRVKTEMGLHTTLGVSNIAFGLPEKTHATAAFLISALHAGLDLPIVNPNSQSIADAISSYRAISGEDKDCQAYITRFAEKKEEKPQIPTQTQGMDIETAILKGLGSETEKATEDLLKTMDPMDVINTKLIPALDIVGDKYEKHELFLPQLINSANAAGKGFDLIKKRLPKKNGSSKGKIIIATVEGDIHDIGKNIVKVVLENYGYDVIDLGKDVPVQTVVQRTIEEDAHLVALSALMTTTVESMKRTIEALRQSGHVCKVVVGGAVLTKEYAKMIGADYYAKDPKESADTARKVLG